MNNAELMLEVNRLSTIEKLQKENKILNDKLGKIERIVNKSYTEDEFYNVVQDIKEVLENG